MEREGRDRQEENGAATRGHSGFMHATHRHVWPVACWCSRASCADPSNPPSQPIKKKVQFEHTRCLFVFAVLLNRFCTGRQAKELFNYWQKPTQTRLKRGGKRAKTREFRFSFLFFFLHFF